MPGAGARIPSRTSLRRNPLLRRVIRDIVAGKDSCPYRCEKGFTHQRTLDREGMAAHTDDIPVAALLAAAQRPEVVAAMRAFFTEADREIAARPATCWNKGECCRFGQFGHRLYVTALEVCYYLAGGDRPGPVTDDTCPHAVGGKCHARDHRPLGCRIFYCDPAAQAWQGPLTEARLARLRELHRELDVPYLYADWLTVLRAINASIE